MEVCGGLVRGVTRWLWTLQVWNSWSDMDLIDGADGRCL